MEVRNEVKCDLRKGKPGDVARRRKIRARVEQRNVRMRAGDRCWEYEAAFLNYHGASQSVPGTSQRSYGLVYLIS